MEETYTDILDDETLAPLKRNHACLQVRLNQPSVIRLCPVSFHWLP